MFEKIVAFSTTATLGFIVCLIMEISPSHSILAGCLIGSSEVMIYKYLQGDFSKMSRLKKYKYRFQQHPFDTWRYFSVNAPNQDQANLKAQDIFCVLVTENRTVMRVFYPAN